MFAFEGEKRRCVAMPLGGVGTGNLAIHADGSLRQWQIHNRINHQGYLPHSFFAVHWKGRESSGARLLQSKEFWQEEGFVPAKSVTDHVVPPEMMRTLAELPGLDSTSVAAAYPFTQIRYDFEAPFEIKLTAWSPLVEGDPDNSGWPVAIFDFELTSRSEHPLTLSLLSCLQNAVGWNGADSISGVECDGYGGNLNLASPFGVELRGTSLPEDHPYQGVMMHASSATHLIKCAQWNDLAKLWRAFERGSLPEVLDGSPSPKGRTWNSALAAREELAPGETKRITFILAWHFPNRYVDWAQWENLIPAGRSRFYLGNRYARRGEPSFWMSDLIQRLPELRSQSEDYLAKLHAELPDPLAQSVSSAVANLRTNVCLWTEDGRFYGFEGGHGASTWDTVGGCCPMNCTHVWNYEQGLAEVWPDLFRSMRESDWNLNLSPSGQLPHRITLPVYVRKLWDVSIGGPENPALDGVFAAVLKTWQYGQHHSEWLKSVAAPVTKAMSWVMENSDRGDGVIEGEQPNTYDIHLYGPNTFIGSQYLAALLAMAKIAEAVGQDATVYRDRFESGRRLYDEICWNGEYYVQRIPEGTDHPYQFGEGCVTDQLLGQWWAFHLDLGFVLPEDHVRAAVAAIFRRNFRADFVGFKQEPRTFASDHDRGLLIATYEPEQRPKVPLLYSDEVWTGIEYAFAALCFHLQMREEGMQVVNAVRDRYDGTQRNPFNEVECGDHYIRALSSWSLRKAWN